MDGIQNMVTLDDLFNRLRLEPNMGPDQKQGILNQILEDASRGVPPSMKYFAPPMEAPSDMFTLQPNSSDMFRRKFPGDDVPLRQGEMMQENNPLMTRSQVQSDMELDNVAKEMRARAQARKMNSPLNSLRR